MPGSNPVSSTPVSTAAQSKSIRSRFGFGQNSPASVSKPSFFSQLNLKHARKTSTPIHDRTGQDETIVVINHEDRSVVPMKPSAASPSTPANSERKSMDFDSLSKATASRIKHVLTRSFSASPVDRQNDNSTTSDYHPEADESALSKQLPDLPNDLSLIMNEQPLPDTASSYGGDFDESRGSALDLENFSSMPDQTQEETIYQRFQEPIYPSSSASPNVVDISVEHCMGETPDKSRSLSSMNSNGLHLSAELSAGGGPVTSTPFISRKVSLSQAQEREEDISFNLDALDPDLVALLRPNNFITKANQYATSSPSEPFRPFTEGSRPGSRGSPSFSRFASPDASPTRPGFRVPLQPVVPSSPSPALNRSNTSPLPPSSPPSPLRSQSFRSQAVQRVMPPSHAPKPTSSRENIPWLDIHRMEHGSPTGHSTVTSSELGTPSDVSKQPSPLSAPPLTFGELQRKQELQYPPNSASIRSGSTSDLRRSAFNDHIRESTSAIPASRPASRLAQRLGEYRPTSASPEISRPNGSAMGNLGHNRERFRNQTEEFMPPSRPASRLARSNSATLIERSPRRPRVNSTAGVPQPPENESFARRRLRKRSMSLDQSQSSFQEELRANGIITSQYDRQEENVSEIGGYTHGRATSEYGGSSSFLGRDGERSAMRSRFGNGGRETPTRISREWLGPRATRAFAAAGLLDDSGDNNGTRHKTLSRSIVNDRDYRTNSSFTTTRDHPGSSRGGVSSVEMDRERDTSRYASRRNMEYESRHSAIRSDAISPSITGSAGRPLSRADSWSNSRPGPLFARTISDLVSSHGDRRESMGSVHPRTGSSSYSGGGLYSGSTGSGGGRTSPTTTSSLVAAQSHIQSLKEKHDTQTEALLAALADSQSMCKDLRAENDALKSRVKELEDRLIDAVEDLKAKDKDLIRSTRARRLHSPERQRVPSSGRNLEFRGQSRPASPPKQTAVRRSSTSSSIFPAIPKTMSLLMAERPESPTKSFGSTSSPPPSPTLVLPKLAVKQKQSEPPLQLYDPPTQASSSIPATHKRSMSGASIATSANFSIETGSPGSLKLKPEHEFLLGDVTQLSLVSEVGDESG
ncbi:hypothetical protein M422DRAFT_24588 [Sphaerobolus stellatus SS14]|nr:hypothetical protein M422DRAFT_24588 [Sphaerobolus stellatus SS14]